MNITNEMNASAVVEASTLGWQPGYFAQWFDRDGKSWTRVRTESNEGGVVAVHYVARGGGRLVVLND
jgi:hypothetical protein